jgi:hypothetical protein
MEINGTTTTPATKSSPPAPMDIDDPNITSTTKYSSPIPMDQTSDDTALQAEPPNDKNTPSIPPTSTQKHHDASGNPVDVQSAYFPPMDREAWDMKTIKKLQGKDEVCSKIINKQKKDPHKSFHVDDNGILWHYPKRSTVTPGSTILTTRGHHRHN